MVGQCTLSTPFFLTSLTSLCSSDISARIARNSDNMNPKSISLISSCGKVDRSDTAHVGNPRGHLCSANRISSMLFFALVGPCRRRPCRNRSFLTSSHSYRCCLAGSVSMAVKWSAHNFTSVSCTIMSILLCK